MSKNVTAEERIEREAQAKVHAAAGHVQVVLPGGKRRMMTAAQYQRWLASR